MGRPRKYNTEEEAKIANRERANLRYQRLKDNEEFKAANKANRKRWEKNNPEKRNKRYKRFYHNHKDEMAEKSAKYRSTQNGRARTLLCAYKESDKKYNRGECTIDAQWIIDNIFSKPCNYCGETDWTKLGCDRIDNNLPHTPENCVPCCVECNKKRGTTPYEEYLELICNSQTD